MVLPPLLGSVLLAAAAATAAVPVRTGEVWFHAPLFADGMILQRDAPIKIWGSSNNLDNVVTVFVLADDQRQTVLSNATAVTNHTTGVWTATLPVEGVPASPRTQLMATDTDGNTAVVNNVAWGDVLLCGGQSNMGYGMCGALSGTQTPTQAMAALPSALRYFFNHGSGPGGGAPDTACNGVHYSTPNGSWFTPGINTTNGRSNTGGASAVCMLTAAALWRHLGSGAVPVGAVESCQSATNVQPWTPAPGGGAGDGALWTEWMQPLVPFHWKAVLWDQGEADAKRTNSTWYRHEFPAMIQGWRSRFQQPSLPFVYVELCTEYGAAGFWEAQRAAVVRHSSTVGFATTTDIQRALHPPDKQDVTARLLLELRRVAYGDRSVVSRGPTVLSHSLSSQRRWQQQQQQQHQEEGGDLLPQQSSPRSPRSPRSGEGNGTLLTLKMSSAALVVRAGILVGCKQCIAQDWNADHSAPGRSCRPECSAVCTDAAGLSGAISTVNASNNATVPLPYRIDGAVITVDLSSARAAAAAAAVVGQQQQQQQQQQSIVVRINSDHATCFLYDRESQLPAVPVELPV
jgi:sialate O-acetylesterase